MGVETTIENGTLVTATETVDGGIAIDDGRIVAIGAERMLPRSDRTIDASGCYVLPGVVDPHVHIDDHVSIDTYETATRAAARGGVTTVIDFGWQDDTDSTGPGDPQGSLTAGIERKRRKGADALVDYSLHGGILRESDSLFEELDALIDSGITSFKVYSTYDFGLSNGYVRRVFQALADRNAVVVGHTEDDSVCRTLTEQYRQEDETASETLALARPDYDEAVNERGLSVPFVVHTMCTTPAQTFGLAQKGTLTPGTDADVVVFDPSETHTVDARTNESLADYSIYAGREITGAVKTTLVRGTVVATDGEVVASDTGRFIERTCPRWES